jgi:hypothetical protein
MMIFLYSVVKEPQCNVHLTRNPRDIPEVLLYERGALSLELKESIVWGCEPNKEGEKRRWKEIS